ncbi:dynein regulatory complex subunit 5-like isoform X3 [Acropora muricata]
MNFEWHLFQFTARDCLLLAKAVKACHTLKVLHLHRSGIDDEKDGGKSLQEGMEENTAIQSMDLRLTEVGQENEYCINQLLKRNREEQYQQGRNS